MLCSLTPNTYHFDIHNHRVYAAADFEYTPDAFLSESIKGSIWTSAPFSGIRPTDEIVLEFEKVLQSRFVADFEVLKLPFSELCFYVFSTFPRLNYRWLCNYGACFYADCSSNTHYLSELV